MTRRRPRKKMRFGRILVITFLLVSFIVMGAGIGFVVGALRNMPQYDPKSITGDLSSLIFDKNDDLVTSLRTDKNRTELSQDEIPQIIKQAVVAIEDQRFYKHPGVDLYRFMGAVVANIKEGYFAQGGSTITQQLVKIAVLENPEKKIRRKIQEMFISLRLEQMYSKDEILAFYLNNVPYGHGAWSLQTASQIYFGKDAKNLNLSEAAMLAGVINAPGRYSPYRNPDKAKQRQALVLNEMVNMGYISQEEADKAKSEEFNLAGLQPINYKYQSYIDYVVEEASEILQLDEEQTIDLYRSGYRIYTAMDAKAQENGENVFADVSNFPPDKGGKIVQSAMVVLDPHRGEIRTILGGRNQKGARQFNRATSATRQPGSTFKPIVAYAPALELGYSPATVIDDYPMEYQTPQGPKTFINYDKHYRGLISMRTAIQYSVNTAAVKMLEKIGIQEGFYFARKLGISTLAESGKANDMGLSLALGGITHGVSPLELAAAYGTFANQGIYIKPHAIRRIEDKDGNILYESKPKKSVVMSQQTAYLMTDMLQTVVQAGTGRKAQLDRPVAGKTGTTSFDLDAWFVGYTPDLVGTIWLGFDVYDKNAKMTNVYGGGYGAPIWNKVMQTAHEELPVSDFPLPEGIISIPVDYKSGLLPSDLTPPEYVVMEKFNKDNAPLETSNVWVRMPVCAVSGSKPTTDCPRTISKVFLKRPIPWMGEEIPDDAVLEPPQDYCSIHSYNNTTNSSFRIQGSKITENTTTKGIRLTWRYDSVTPETIFKLYRSTQPNIVINPTNKIAEIKGLTFTWQDNDINTDGDYYYVMIAFNPNTGAISQQSNIISIKSSQNISTELPTPKLGAIININGNKADVKLSWNKPTDNKSLNYYLYRSETADFTPQAKNQIALGETITDTTWTDKDLERNKKYYYRIIAYDRESRLQSAPSDQLTIIIK